MQWSGMAQTDSKSKHETKDYSQEHIKQIDECRRW
jgi:hypothetical protein